MEPINGTGIIVFVEHGTNMLVKDCTLFKDEEGKAYFIFDSYPADKSIVRCPTLPNYRMTI